MVVVVGSSTSSGTVVVVVGSVDLVGHRGRGRGLRRPSSGTVVVVVGSSTSSGTVVAGVVVVLANEQSRARIDWSPWPG